MCKAKKALSVIIYIHLALAACLAASRQVHSSDPEQIFSHAVELHQAGDIQGAIREYEAFLAIRPQRVDARSNLGAAYARLGRYEQAIVEYQRALAIEPGNATIRFNLSLAFYKGAHFREAAAELAQVIPAQPQNKNAVLLMADCNLRMGEYKKVVESLMPLETTESGDRTVSFLLGTALLNDGQVDKGQVYLDRILRDGDSAEARALMGSVRMEAHDYPGAIEEFRHALQVNPGLPRLYSLYGRALLAIGDRDGAIAAFKSQLETDPNDFDSNLYIGMILKQDEKYEDALSYIQRGLVVRPGDLGARYYLGSLYVSLGKTTEGESMLEQVVKEAPDFVAAHVSLATAYYRMKRKQDGDRERAIIQKLNAEKQAAAPGAAEGLGPAYRGEQAPLPRKQPKP